MSLGSGIRSCICATTSYENFSAEITINQSAIFWSRVLSGISYISKGRLRCHLWCLLTTGYQALGLMVSHFSTEIWMKTRNPIHILRISCFRMLVALITSWVEEPTSCRFPTVDMVMLIDKKQANFFYLFVFVCVCVCVLCVYAYISDMLWCWWRSLLTL